MSDSSFDVLVIGAGMVGSATAAQLALRGLNVGLVDRQPPGEGTSYGNAGVIDSAAFVPVPFPRHLPTLLRYARGQTPHLNFHPTFLPQILPWLFHYWRESSPKRILAACERMAPLSAHAVSEHTRLASAADASALIRHNGWMHLYRTAAGFAADEGEREILLRYGIALEVIDQDKLAELEPHVAPVAHKVAFIKDAASTSDPGQLTKAYASLVTRHGGRIILADARGLMRGNGRWLLTREDGDTLTADQVVIALGPWGKDFLKPFGIEVPIGVKRGYHMHYTAQGNATLSRPLVDAENGFCLTPMTKGIRMTTGAEFAHRDARATPIQVERAEKLARTMFPLAERAEAQPWLGKRPNTPDSAPIIGAAPGQPGMWLAMGHGHWGLALGPATGRLVADLVQGVTPVVDPKGLGIERFG